MDKRKLLLIDNSTEFTGAFKSALNIANSLDNYETIFCVPRNSKVIPNLRERGYGYHEVQFLELKKNLSAFVYIPKLILNSFRLKKIIKQENINCIHVNDMYNLLGVAVKLLGVKCPLFYHVRLLKSSYIRPIYSTLAHVIQRFSDEIIFVSKSVENDFGVSEKTQVISDTMSFPDHGLTQGSHGTIDVYYVSSFISGKGQDKALRVFESAYERNKRLRLHFVGGTFDKSSNVRFFEDIKERALKLFGDEVVTFHGHQSDVVGSLRHADVFLNCSQSESFSYTTLEALHMGLPTVVMDSGGVKELFENNKSGFLVGPSDFNRASDLIVELSLNSELRKSVGMEAKSYVRRVFNPENIKTALQSLYGRYENKFVSEVGLKGFYGFGNFGDDILMVASFNFLKSILPEANIQVVSDGPGCDYIENLVGESVEIVRHGQDKTFDVMFLGGGGIFFDFDKGSFPWLLLNSIIYFLGPSKYRYIREKSRPIRPSYRLGVGIGLGAGSYTRSSKKYNGSIYEISKMNLLVMRDQRSLEQMKRLDSKAHLDLSTDLAFAKKYWMPVNEISKKPNISSKPRIGFVLRKWKWGEKNETVGAILALKNLYDIRIILFQKEADRECSEPFVEKGIPVFSWDPHCMKIDECVRELADCDVVVSARAHGCIVSGLLGVPFVALAIEPKLVAIQKMFPNGSILSDETSVVELEKTIEKMLNGIDGYRAGCVEDSKRQSKILDESLCKVKSLILEAHVRGV